MRNKSKKRRRFRVVIECGLSSRKRTHLIRDGNWVGGQKPKHVEKHVQEEHYKECVRGTSYFDILPLVSCFSFLYLSLYSSSQLFSCPLVRFSILATQTSIVSCAYIVRKTSYLTSLCQFLYSSFGCPTPRAWVSSDIESTDRSAWISKPQRRVLTTKLLRPLLLSECR